MIVRTKYKRWQFVMEWVTLGLYIAWFIAALILLNYFCDQETEILKRNLLMMSFILDVLAYLGFTSMSLLPHNNGLIKTESYVKGTKEYQYKRESRLRSLALIAKAVCILIIAFIGISQYI